MLAPVLIFQVDEIYPRVRAYDWFDADALFFVFEENWDADLVINNLMALHVQAFSIGIPRNSGDVLLVSPEHLIAAIEVSIEYWEDWQEQGRDSNTIALEGSSIFFHVPTDEEIELMRAAWRAECEDLDKESEELGAKDGSGEPPHRRENRRFLTGRGRYVHNIVLPQQLHAVFPRSSHAHAENRSDR